MPMAALEQEVTQNESGPDTNKCYHIGQSLVMGFPFRREEMHHLSSHGKFLWV